MRKMRAFLNYVIILLILGWFFSGCIKDEEIDYDELERENIAGFLQRNGITVEPTASGLYYVEEEEGTGVQPVDGDTVEVNYIGYWISGIIFETNMEDIAYDYNIWDPNFTYEPVELIVGAENVMEGWSEGLCYMKEGGKATLIIPYRLTFEGNYNTLVYYIELLEVRQKNGDQ
jgi:FKBP-type peptidyl-prolyl cis-trans isomerase